MNRGKGLLCGRQKPMVSRGISHPAPKIKDLYQVRRLGPPGTVKKEELDSGEEKVS